MGFRHLFYHDSTGTINLTHRAEWLGNDNRKTMIKVKAIGQILPFKSGTALPSPAQASGCVPGTARILKGEYIL